MKRQLLVLSTILFLGGSSSTIPVTFNGQSFEEYVSEEEKCDVSPPVVTLHRKWRLRSFNGYVALYGILLEDLNIWLSLTQEEEGAGYSYYSNGVMNSFWGNYEFNQNGGFAILSSGDDRVLRIRSAETRRIESKFRQLVVNAAAYEMTGSEMRLYTENEYLEFYAID